MPIKLRSRLSGVIGGVDYNAWRRYRDGSQAYREAFLEEWQQGLEEGHLKPEQFSFRRLFESLVQDGREMVDSWHPSNQGASRVNLSVQEAAGSVSSADFSNISGQIMFAAVLETWNNPEMLHPMLMDDVQTPYSGEKIPGIGNIGDVSQVVREGNPYPTAGVSEEYIETPATTKRGLIVPVTKEAIFFDRTGLLVQQTKDLTQVLLINKEKRCLDVALGITDVYRRNGGAAQATYGASHTNGDFVNLKTSNGLVDWTNVEAADLLFDAITDPNTGEPIVIDRTRLAIVVARAKVKTAERIFNATSVRYGLDQGGGSATAVTQTYSPNPISSVPILSNAYVKNRTGSDTTWFWGDFKAAFKYRVNWPITSVTAPAGSQAEFERDIIQQTKISEMGVASVEEPRKVIKVTA